MARFLLTSLVLSVVATIALNLLARRSVRRRPPGRWAPPRFDADEPPFDQRSLSGTRVRVFVPWKAMVIASIALTIVLNVVLALR